MRTRKPDDVEEPMTVKRFLFAYKRGSIFPAAAIAEACDELPEELRTRRRTWAEWLKEFEEHT